MDLDEIGEMEGDSTLLGNGDYMKSNKGGKRRGDSMVLDGNLAA